MSNEGSSGGRIAQGVTVHALRQWEGRFPAGLVPIGAAHTTGCAPYVRTPADHRLVSTQLWERTKSTLF